MKFATRKSVRQVEEGSELAPRFDDAGLIPVITTDYATGEVLMHAYMNREALEKTVETGVAHYWSRSRKALWRKGEVSGLTQRIRQMRIDDDQDAIWLRVDVTGDASCHVGYRSCFYREIRRKGDAHTTLEQIENEKVFDPEKIYKGKPNPTQL